MWFMYLARFLGGAFVANAVPHFVSGVQGRPFPSPFASPPGKGLSSPMVNVVWGSANAAVGYYLLYGVRPAAQLSAMEVVAAAVGWFLLSIMLAQHFGDVFGAGERR